MPLQILCGQIFWKFSCYLKVRNEIFIFYIFANAAYFAHNFDISNYFSL